MSRGLACAFAGSFVWLLLSVVSAARAQEAPAAASAPAAAAAEGTIAGKVIDKGTGEPMIDAGVEVVGTNKRARTDLDGKYSFKIPVGTYQVRFFAALYQGARVDDVRVVAGQKTTADAALAPEGKGGVEVVEVVAKADKSAESIQLIERKNAAVVSDNIGAQAIKQSTDSNAAEVVEGVPSVTVRDNKYIYVRGLGERYSTALLNGSKLPSTDPNKRVVPLDLFPSDFIESISIIKGYTPDLPGDFSGGLVNIELRDPPETLSYSIGMGSSGDTNTTFKSFQDYPGTSGDLFGFGKGSRSLPAIIPDRDIDQCPSCPTGSTPDGQERAYSDSFKNVWTPTSETAPPNFGFNGNIGNTFGPFGISLAGIWDFDYQTLPTEIANSYTSGGLADPIIPVDLFTYRRSTQTAHLGGVLTSAYKINADNRINFRAFDNHVGTDYVLDGSGFNFANPESTFSQTTLYYQEQNLGWGQLEGEHHFKPFDKPLTINWRSALSQTTLDAPDSRYITRENGDLYSNSNSGLRTFLDLSEYLTDSAVDFTIPFATGLPFTDVWSGLPASLKFGPAYTYRNRNLDYRRFRYQTNGGSMIDLAQPAEALFVEQNVGNGRQFTFQEDTVPADTFDASQEVAALYGMVDAPIIPDRLRLIAGVRVEYSYITINGFSSGGFGADPGAPVHVNLNDLDPLPAVNLVYTPQNDMNVRFGYSQTVSRPEFRELTPTEFVQPLGFRSVIGNPNLVEANIRSFDVRWEWFLSPLEILSVSAFYKDLEKPIEQTVIPRSSSVADGFTNATDGTLEGFEFEARKNFDFLIDPAREYISGAVADQMKNVSVLANVSYVHSNVNIDVQPGDIQAQSNRALQGQAPYVVNAALEYALPDVATTRLIYNTAGKTIAAVGTKTNGGDNVPFLPNIEDSQRGELDFVVTGKINPFGVPLNAKLGIENLLNSAYEQVQGPNITQRYRLGVQFGVSLSYSF